MVLFPNHIHKHVNEINFFFFIIIIILTLFSRRFFFYLFPYHFNSVRQRITHSFDELSKGIFLYIYASLAGFVCSFLYFVFPCMSFEQRFMYTIFVWFFFYLYIRYVYNVLHTIVLVVTLSFYVISYYSSCDAYSEERKKNRFKCN